MNDDFLMGVETLNGTLAQRVYTSLKKAILSMKYPPGTVINKKQICEELGVSRSPVSEAIARLSAEGLLDVIPQSATKVSCFSLEDLLEANFLREALELAVVAKVANEATDEQIGLLSRNVRLQGLLVSDGDSEGFYKTDEEFHAMLMEFTGFPGVAGAASKIALQLKRARMLLLPEEGRIPEVYNEHKDILEAITEKDPSRAQAAMKYHLGQLMPRLRPLESKYPEFFRSR